MHEKMILIFIIINLPVLAFYNNIVNKFAIFDIADGVRKIHKKKIPLFGGTLIIYNIFVLTLCKYFLNLNSEVLFLNTRELTSFFGGIILFYFVGIYDDKFNLSAIKKLSLNFFIIIFLILLDDNLVIKELSFSFFENKIQLKNVSYFFTILCILLLINALNMFDGINLQAASYCLLIFLIFIFKDMYHFHSLNLVMILILFLFFNYNNKIFLGDSGTQILAFLISYILIKSYNLDGKIMPEEIFVILSFPGIDMFRLFLSRILVNKNPFKADRNHLHHLIELKYNQTLAFLIIFFVICINILFFYFFSNKLYSILTIFLSYFTLFLIFKNNGKVKKI